MKSIDDRLLKDLANIVRSYDEPCDRVPGINEKCSRGQYNHINPSYTESSESEGKSNGKPNAKLLNCRSYCLRDRKIKSIEQFLSRLPNMMEVGKMRVCLQYLDPIDFYGTDRSGNVFPDMDLKTISGNDFVNWTVVYDLSSSQVFNCQTDEALDRALDRFVKIGQTLALKGKDVNFTLVSGDGDSDNQNFEASLFGSVGNWSDITISRPEHFILVVTYEFKRTSR